MRYSKYTQSIDIVCDNCLNIYKTYRDADGIIRFHCPQCGTILNVRKINKYYFRKEIRYPRSLEQN